MGSKFLKLNFCTLHTGYDNVYLQSPFTEHAGGAGNDDSEGGAAMVAEIKQLKERIAELEGRL